MNLKVLGVLKKRECKAGLVFAQNLGYLKEIRRIYFCSPTFDTWKKYT